MSVRSQWAEFPLAQVNLPASGVGPNKGGEATEQQHSAAFQTVLPDVRAAEDQASAIRVIVRPALTASSRQRCSTESSRSGLGSSLLRG